MTSCQVRVGLIFQPLYQVEVGLLIGAVRLAAQSAATVLQPVWR